MAVGKICLRVRGQLAIGGMINCFNAHNVTSNRELLAVHVVDKVQLRRRRANQQHGIGAVQERDNFRKEVLFILWMRLSVAAGMTMMRAVQRCLHHIARARIRRNLKYTRFFVVKPNDYLFRHTFLCAQRRRGWLHVRC